MRNEGVPESTMVLLSDGFTVAFVSVPSVLISQPNAEFESDSLPPIRSSLQAQVVKRVALIISRHKKRLRKFLCFILLPLFKN